MLIILGEIKDIQQHTVTQFDVSHQLGFDTSLIGEI